MEENLKKYTLSLSSAKEQRPWKYRLMQTWYAGLVVILTSCLLLAGWGFYLPKEVNSETEILFEIVKGKGLDEIAQDLKTKGLIKSEFLFKTLALVKGSHNRLLAGSYDLSPSMSAAAILKKINKGDITKETVTVIEGWDLEDMAHYFENQGIFQTNELFEITGFPAKTRQKAEIDPKDRFNNFSFLSEKPNYISLEGYLFPDTYEKAKNETVEEVIEKMLTNFESKISDELLAKIEKQGKTLFQIITMASLLEKEVIGLEDKQIAAGLLWKRMDSDWPLQIDATLTYLTGRASLELTKDDLNIDSRYNTYRYYGLPLGPICNPGLESIEAAVYPKESPFWFYLTTAEGETIFSKTLQEHNAARRKYLK